MTVKREAFLREACGNVARCALPSRSCCPPTERADEFFRESSAILKPPTELADVSLKRGAASKRSAGTRVGPYKLMERLGEGGSGVVYLALQETPVRRPVALKIP
jgi:hypothetical protein